MFIKPKGAILMSFMLITYVIPILIIVAIVTWGKVKRAEVEAISKKSFEKLTSELREDNAYLKIKLSIIEEKLNSIDKMLKDVG